MDYNIEKRERKNEEIEVVDFDLGEDVITDSNGRKVKYRVRGTMAVPKGDGRYPVVVIGHGSHDNAASNRFDPGFKYLVEDVAKEGYIGLSMDIQMQFSLDNGEAQGFERLEAIYKNHMSKLKDANEGKESGYKINLENKIDFDNKIFIGHSRSGQDMSLLANKLIKEGDNSIKGMISVAPPNATYISKNEDAEQGVSEDYYADIPTGFIIPEYDGDAASLDGLTIYDEILTYDKERKSPMSAVVLKGGKHNFFNTLLEEDTTFLEQQIVIVNKLKEEQQRDFMTNYTLDFLDSIIKGNNIIFNEKNPAPNSMYGYDVITKLSTEKTGSKDLIDVKNVESIKGDKLSVEATIEDWRPGNDKIGPFRDPRSAPDYIDLLSLTWKEKGASALIDVKENKDFSKYEALSIQLTQDPINEANKKDINQAFTLVLKDAKGKEQKIVIGKETTVLEYINGEIVDLGDYKYYGNYTPIGELRIPMEYFEGIDLTNIKSLELLFDQTDSGNIVIEEIKLESKK